MLAVPVMYTFSGTPLLKKYEASVTATYTGTRNDPSAPSL